MARAPLSRDASSLDLQPLEPFLQHVVGLRLDDLRALWRTTFQNSAPPALSRDLLVRAITYRIQEQRRGGLDPGVRDLLARLARGQAAPVRRLKPGSVIVRQHGGTLHEVVVVPGGFLWCGTLHASLSAIARAITGTAWNGPRFFGLRDKAVTDGTAGRGNPIGRTTSKPKVRGSIQPSQTGTREATAMPRSVVVTKSQQEARP
jgi:hypothetical protein